MLRDAKRNREYMQQKFGEVKPNNTMVFAPVNDGDTTDHTAYILRPSLENSLLYKKLTDKNYLPMNASLDAYDQESFKTQAQNVFIEYKDGKFSYTAYNNPTKYFDTRAQLEQYFLGPDGAQDVEANKSAQPIISTDLKAVELQPNGMLRVSDQDDNFKDIAPIAPDLPYYVVDITDPSSPNANKKGIYDPELQTFISYEGLI